MKNSKNTKTIKNYGEILNFEKIEGCNIYNPSDPFEYNNKKIILARVEDIKNLTSQILAFEFDEEKNIWKKLNWHLSDKELEDPFITKIDDEYIVGAVYVYPHPSGISPTEFHTIFYRGKDIFNLKEFARGPFLMKDIRLVKFKDKISVFTRPKGGKYLNGRIYYLELNSLKDLNEENLLKGELIELPIDENEWVGSNSVYVLDNKNLRVLGHIAYRDQKGLLHYSAMTFIFDPSTFKVKNFKIIARRKDFPQGETKSEETRDVVFPGGLFKENNKIYLYTGLSDAQIGRIEIKNPWN